MMERNYWLIKTEPNTYSWQDFTRLGKDHWDGVRNYAARNHLKAMKVGDLALFYHSVNEKSIVGMARVVTAHYPDPTTDDPKWVAVDLVPEQKLEHPVSLAEVKLDPRLSDMVLVNNPRLSVQPVRQEEFELILSMSRSPQS